MWFLKQNFVEFKSDKEVKKIFLSRCHFTEANLGIEVAISSNLWLASEQRTLVRFDKILSGDK